LRAITGSPILGNTVTGTDVRGGGLVQGGTLTVTGSPIQGNTATGTNARGGGVFHDGGTINLLGSSVVANQAVGSGADGGGVWREGGTVTLTGAVVGNQPNNCAPPRHCARLFLGNAPARAATGLGVRVARPGRRPCPTSWKVGSASGSQRRQRCSS
jgi:hypothetical protein